MQQINSTIVVKEVKGKTSANEDLKVKDPSVEESLEIIMNAIKKWEATLKAKRINKNK